MGLQVKDFYKKYGDKVVLNGLSFEMNSPGVYALLGTNGAGKTTAIRMMLGMLAKDRGEVLWNGEPLSLDKCNVGYLAEERGLYPKYSIMDQLLYFAELRGVSKNEAKKRIAYMSSRLEVDEYLYPQQSAAPALKGGLWPPGAAEEQRRRSRSLPISFQREISRRYSSWRRFCRIRSLLYLMSRCPALTL